MVNYDFPMHSEVVYSRSQLGHTGRAHAIGDAISFITPEDQGPLRSLERSSAAGSLSKRRKVSITISLRRHATTGAGSAESSERSSRDYQEILRVEVATPRTARSGGVSRNASSNNRLPRRSYRRHRSFISQKSGWYLNI